MRAEGMPIVGVSMKKALGCTSYDEQGFFSIRQGKRVEPGFCKPMRLDQLMDQELDFDAWFCTYRLVRDGRWEEHWPRCNKAALPSIRERGGELFTTCMVLDYDNPGHAAWTPDLKAAFQASIARAHERKFLFALAWQYLYYTRSGARLIYVLREPVVVDQFEPHVHGMIDSFFSQGIIIDRDCADWTRLFRAPRVLRQDDDGGQVEKTSAAEHFSIIYNQHAPPLDISAVPIGKAKASKPSPSAILDDPMPDPNVAVELLEEISPSGRTVKTPWYKAARKALEGCGCYSVIFQDQELARPGCRNSAIQRLVGEALANLANTPGTSRELVFALFVPAGLRLATQDPDPTEDWTETIWKAICRYWAQEEAKRIQEESEREQYVESVRSLESLVIEGMRSWCDDPSLHTDDSTALWWMRERCLVLTDRCAHILRPDGRYDPMPNFMHGIKARIRELRMDGLIPLEEDTKNGKKAVNVNTIIDRHATRARIITAACGINGGVIRNIGSPNAVLEFGLYGKKNLTGDFDPEIHAWLIRLTKLCPRALDWFGHFPDFSSPICALSIVGPPACGKKLLARGLAEILDTEVYADKGVFGQYKTMLLSTPLVVVNEGWPEGSQAGLADQFRSFVGGDATHVEQKFKDTVVVHAPVRLMITGNNMGVVQALTGNRDLGPMDRDALLEKLLHCPVPQEASDYLRTMGGLEFTRGWVRGDDGSPSDYRLARHILWLYENRKPMRPGSRYLVEGEKDNPMLFHMISTTSGRAPEVVEALVHMVETVSGGTQGIVISGSQIFVTVNAVICHMRQWFQDVRNPTHKSVGSALRGLTVEGSSLEPRRLEDASGNAQIARWREIDVSLLFEEALEQGYPCKKLQEIYQQSRTASRIAAEAARAALEEA